MCAKQPSRGDNKNGTVISLHINIHLTCPIYIFCIHAIMKNKSKIGKNAFDDKSFDCDDEKIHTKGARAVPR